MIGNCWGTWLIMLGFMDLRWPRVCRRSTSVLLFMWYYQFFRMCCIHQYTSGLCHWHRGNRMWFPSVLAVNSLRPRDAHIYMSVDYTTISSDNGLSPYRRQAIISPKAGMLSIGPLGTYFSEICIKRCQFSLTKINLTMSSEKYRPFCLGLVLN